MEKIESTYGYGSPNAKFLCGNPQVNVSKIMIYVATASSQHGNIIKLVSGKRKHRIIHPSNQPKSQNSFPFFRHLGKTGISLELGLVRLYTRTVWGRPAGESSFELFFDIAFVNRSSRARGYVDHAGILTAQLVGIHGMAHLGSISFSIPQWAADQPGNSLHQYATRQCHLASCPGCTKDIPSSVGGDVSLGLTAGFAP